MGAEAVHPPFATDLFGRRPGRDERAAPSRQPRSGRNTGLAVHLAGGRSHVGERDALLALDIETVPDTDLMPPGWPADKFPKNAWHRIVCISFVTADIERVDGLEAYSVTSCRTGGEADRDEARLLKAFWRFFRERQYRVLTWNGRAFDMPTILSRSLMYGIDASAWFQDGSRWEGYRHRFATDWHLDLMDAMSEHGAAQRLTLEEGAAMIGLPGKMGEHGSCVSSMVAAGDVERVRAYCETDCLNLAVLYFRWAFLTGRTDTVGHDKAVSGMIDLLGGERGARPHLGHFLDAWLANADRRPHFLSAR